MPSGLTLKPGPLDPDFYCVQAFEVISKNLTATTYGGSVDLPLTRSHEKGAVEKFYLQITVTRFRPPARRSYNPFCNYLVAILFSPFHPWSSKYLMVIGFLPVTDLYFSFGYPKAITE